MSQNYIIPGLDVLPVTLSLPFVSMSLKPYLDLLTSQDPGVWSQDAARGLGIPIPQYAIKTLFLGLL